MSLTVGKTEESWKKHQIVEMIEGALIGAASTKLTGGGIVIDLHSGDPKGVPHAQGDFFRVNESNTTPVITERLCERFGASGLLCEIVRSRRIALQDRFPSLSVIGDHADAPEFVASLTPIPSWGVCVSDANGHGKVGMEVMAKLGKLIRCLDFVTVFPQGSLKRSMGVYDKWKDQPIEDAPVMVKNCIKGVEATEWMLSDALDQWGDHLPSREWMTRLGRSKMAVTRLISASNGFRYRIIVVSNYLPHGVTRNKMFQEVR